MDFCLSKYVDFFRITVLLILILLFPYKELSSNNNFPYPIIAESSNPIKTHLSSPSIVVMPDGSYLVSNDWRGDENNIYSSVYKSTDKGFTWQLLSMVRGIGRATLFLLENKLYLMGVDLQLGNIVIRKSTDLGKTWTVALNKDTGILFQGNYYTSAVPILFYNGRVWRSFEEKTADGLNVLVLSATVGSDLLNSRSWIRTNSVSLDSDFINASKPEWGDGNIVVTPEGKIVNFLRVYSEQETNGSFEFECPIKEYPRYRLGAKINISNDAKLAQFNPYSDFVNFLGAMNKFTIRYDAQSEKYWTIVNKISQVNYPYTGTFNSPKNQRNVLVLICSSDLVTWEERYRAIAWNDGNIMTQYENFAFQHVDWQFEGNDIVGAVQTSWYGLDSQHANMITFLKIPQFRTIDMSSSPVDLKHLTENIDTILAWQFTDPKSTGREEEALASFVNLNLHPSILTRGSGLSNNVELVRTFSAHTHLSQIEENDKATAIQNNQYFQFTVKARDGYSVSLSSISAKISRNILGPATYRWAYSLNGVDFKEIGSSDIYSLPMEDNEGKVQPTIRLESYQELQSVPSNQTITFRVYFWSATATTGRVSIGRYADTTPSLVVGGVVRSDVKVLNAWQFYTDDGYISTGSEQDFLSTLADESVEQSLLTRGAGASTTVSNHRGGFIGYFNLSANKQDALNNNCYFSFTVRPKQGYSVSLTELDCKIRRQEYSAYIYRWMYSLDEINFQEIGDEDIVIAEYTNNTGYVQPTINLRNYTDLQNITSDNKIIFRIYAWGGQETTTLQKHFGFGQSKLATGPGLMLKGIVNSFSNGDHTTIITSKYNLDKIEIISHDNRVEVIYHNESKARNVNLFLYNQLGSLLLSKNVFIHEGKHQYNLPVKIEKGVYILLVSDDYEIKRFKFTNRNF